MPFFQKWDPKVLEAYVQYGTAEDPVTGKAYLKATSYQVSYQISNTTSHTFSIPYRRPRYFLNVGCPVRTGSSYHDWMIASSFGGL
jgi:hypothetical protein